MYGFIVGAMAGLVATVPMSAAMELMHDQLPPHEQYPLPPREITDEMAEEAGVKHHLDEPEREAAAWVGHFGYGTACGALYGALAKDRGLSPVLAGAGFGLAVWAGSYLGWLPAAGILRPATEHPPRRTALMIAAHLVWGVTTGLVVSGLSDDESRTRER